MTEQGIAYEHGKSLREQAEALIAIAEPCFRDELEDFAVRSHYMKRKPTAVQLT
ncbi:MAG: acetyl-CoA hydrolase/transferase C-terminal domain-containing protein [Terracidiphilus sp.]